MFSKQAFSPWIIRNAAAFAAISLTVCAIDHADAQMTPAQPRFAIYGQATYTEQETDGFHAPYAGPNSLSPRSGRESADATLYVGTRLWGGAELWVNPE